MAHTSPDIGFHAATPGLWQDAQLDDLDISADYNLYNSLHSQAGARNAMDDPGGSAGDPGGGNIDNKGSVCDPSTSTSTSPKTSASFVTSSLTNRVSLLSLSDKSTVDMVGITDYATGSSWFLLFVMLYRAFYAWWTLARWNRMRYVLL